MKLLFPITPKKFEEMYYNILKLLRKDDQYIFNAMKVIDSKFVLPLAEEEYSQKHEEILRKFSYKNIFGNEIAFKLMCEIFTQISEKEMPESKLSIDFLKCAKIQTQEIDVQIILTSNNIIAVEWKIKAYSFGEEELYDILLFLYDKQLNEIVPYYIVELIQGAILSYKKKMYKNAVILLSIATEGALRDALKLKGYDYRARGNKEDDYEFINAQIGLSSNKDGKDGYIIFFDDNMPKNSEEFYESTNGNDYIPVKIKRKKQNGHLDILIRDGCCLIDHLSGADIKKVGRPVVSGLGAALKIARGEAKLLTPIIMPEDLDHIFVAVRNNLIHISEDSFTENIGSQTLADFINEPSHIFDLISNMPKFINHLYTKDIK